ncbi:hypothetical protein ACFODL_04495 [Phenylobacterium terrae]|uniref:Uncharacterized protein n=1 Tax=Phenylobacterium terrae TaxID=2665495 RepID=A0ABW4MWK1_9CAUL
MPSARKNPRPEPLGRVIDFDEGVVQTCGPGERAELEAEVAMLAGAFTHAADPAALRRMARALIRAGGEDRAQRLHARRLAAMMRVKARAAEG